MVDLYVNPLGSSVKIEVASLSHLPKTATRFQKRKLCDYIKKNTP